MRYNRIVFASASPIIGGADVIFHSIIEFIDSPKLVILNSSLQQKVELTSPIVFLSFVQLERRIKSVVRFLFYYPKLVYNIIKIIKKGDLIVANDFLILPFLFPVKLIFRNPIIFYCHSAFKETSFNKKITSRFIDAMTSKTIAPSCFLKNNLKSIGVKNDIQVIYNGIGKININSHDREQKRITIGLFGEIVDLKGQDIFAKAISILTSEKVPIQGILAGRLRDQQYFQQILNSYSESFESEHIRYLGSLARVDALQAMNTCDIIVCASKYGEVLPTVLIEAMSLGKPVIGTCIGGIPEIIEHDNNGLLIAPASAEELAQAIQMIISKNLFDAYGAKGKAMFEQRFSKSVFKKKVTYHINMLDK